MFKRLHRSLSSAAFSMLSKQILIFKICVNPLKSFSAGGPLVNLQTR